ncbi:transcriptional regulator [Nocardia harenae]|uniref:transcriptional regulator n=1 Tax=Nocardia harenae TaxID=358707 RepID=UPI00082B656A|nr:transcriptional regulator [Nocardia harenae]
MIVEKWTAIEVRALRTAALRDTQEQFAERIGWKVPTVRKWERATDARIIQAARAETLDTVLRDLSPEQRQRFIAALGTPPRGHAGSTGGRHAAAIEDEEADVKRRDFGKLTALTATALPAWHQPAARLGVEDVQRLVAVVAQLDAADQRHGGAPLVDTAVRTLDRALALLDSGRYSDATGRALMSATGELAAQAGFLAYDADRHALARRCYSDAFALASSADDAGLTVHACLSAANQALALARQGRGSPSYALTLTGRARDLVRGQPPGRVHALVAVREAQAHGVAGDRLGFGRAIATAWRELDAAHAYERVDECPQWLHFVSPAEIHAHEARGYGDLGDTAQSLARYEITCAEAASPRNAVNARAWLAATRAEIGDASGAVADGIGVLRDLEESVASPRSVRALAPVRALAGKSTASAEFAARFDAIATSQGSPT